MAAIELPFDPATLSFYAAETPIYVASGKDGRSSHLDAFLVRLDRGASVLELGCGGGRDSEAMIGAGFEVDPTDGVPEIAAEAEQRLRRPVRVMRFEQLDAIEAYDAVWANTSLLHLPRTTLPAVLAPIWRALKPGGWHSANFKASGAEGRDRFRRYFKYFNLNEGRRSTPVPRHGKFTALMNMRVAAMRAVGAPGLRLPYRSPDIAAAAGWSIRSIHSTFSGPV